MTSEQRLRELPKAIIKWYEIDRGSKVACVVCDDGNSRLIGEELGDREIDVDLISLDSPDDADEKETYDIVVVMDVIEYAQNAAELLRRVKIMLKPEGTLLLTADNRLGIRYFCGDQDAFSGKNYDGIENYKHLLPWEHKEMRGRTYSKAELVKLLEGTGFYSHRFFSVFPKLSNPQILLAEDYEPNEALDIRVFPEYNNPDTVFLLEEELYPALMENKLLHPMANGFFIECPLGMDHIPVNQVTLSGERGMENAMATIIRSDGLVEKRVLYRDGKKKLQQMMDNHQYLSAHGVKMIDTQRKGDSLIMPYVQGIPATDYFRDLLQKDNDAFLSELDDFWDTILHSSDPAALNEINEEWVGEGIPIEDLGVILKRGYLDLVSLNCFFMNGEFVFYDQESYLEYVPAKAIMLRTIEFIYKFHDQLDHLLSRETLFDRYGITGNKDLYGRCIGRFLNALRCDEELTEYFQETRRNYDTVMKNRERMNYSEEEYTLIFKDIFHQIKGCRLYLFGAGEYARRFRKKYGDIYPIAGYLDNDESRWGTKVDGLFVFNPAILDNMKPEDSKVMICVKNYLPIVKQIRRTHFSNFSVYNPNMLYETLIQRE